MLFVNCFPYNDKLLICHSSQLALHSYTVWTDKACNFIPTCFAHFSLACWQKPSGARSHIPAVVHLSYQRTNTLSSRNLFLEWGFRADNICGKICRVWLCLLTQDAVVCLPAIQKDHRQRDLAKEPQAACAEPGCCMSLLDTAALCAQRQGCSSPVSALLFAVGSCSQPRLSRCNCLLTATCVSSAPFPVKPETG